MIDTSLLDAASTATLRRALAWADDLAWGAEAMYQRFGVVVAPDAFATSGDPSSPLRYLMTAIPVGHDTAMLRLYPSTEEVKAEGVCPCGAVYVSADLRGAKTATPRLQLERLLRHWHSIGDKCGPCEFGAWDDSGD